MVSVGIVVEGIGCGDYGEVGPQVACQDHYLVPLLVESIQHNQENKGEQGEGEGDGVQNKLGFLKIILFSKIFVSLYFNLGGAVGLLIHHHPYR